MRKVRLLKEKTPLTVARSILFNIAGEKKSAID
jgi:hypothetical protein